MSMIGNYRRLTQKELTALQADPETICDVLAELEEADEDKDRHLDIDKSWHAIHFLLCNQAWEGKPPLGNVVLGGTPLGEEDVGYGPARFLTPKEVQQASEALAKISVKELLSRFDGKAMDKAEIYPEGWAETPEDHLEYIGDFYPQLVEFFHTTASKGEAMLVYLN